MLRSKNYISLALCLQFLCTIASGCVYKSPKESVNQLEPSSEQSLIPTPSESGDISSTTMLKEKLYFAFGLFSIGVDGVFEAADTAGHMFGMESYINDAYIVTINYAPLDNFASEPAYAYENTAATSLDSYISYMFAVLLGHGEEAYSETEVYTEQLGQNLTLNWQVMSGARKGIWFEVFTPRYGYNICIVAKEKTEDMDQRLKDMMYSFKYDEDLEYRLANQIMLTNLNGNFSSIDNAFNIILDTEWKLVDRSMLSPDIVFSAERNTAEQLINVYRFPQVSSLDELSSLFDDIISQVQIGQSNGAWQQKQTITLSKMETDAYMQEVEWPSGVIAQYVLFQHGHYTYFGEFMWMKSSNKRTVVEAAMQSIIPIRPINYK